MTNKTPNVYMLECGNAKSSWKVSETALFNECKQWDRHLFTRDDILSLQAQLSDLNAALYKASEKLAASSGKLRGIEDYTEAAAYCRDTLIPNMKAARAYADEIEALTDRAVWPYPTYGDLLFAVR